MLEWLISTKLVEYDYAIDFMEKRINLIEKNQEPELIWCLEHPSIYTAGISAVSEDLLDSCTLPVYNTGRGGKYTYHGPGQRIVYVMLNLKQRNNCDIRNYITFLGNWIVNTLQRYSIKSKFNSNLIGVWVDDSKKIASIGVRVRRWVTYHGFAININPNLEYFKGIVACGLKDSNITSIEELGISTSLAEFDNILKSEFIYNIL